jgi:hypothetical protein
VAVASPVEIFEFAETGTDSHESLIPRSSILFSQANATSGCVQAAKARWRMGGGTDPDSLDHELLRRYAAPTGT